jgi:hypothetical protein
LTINAFSKGKGIVDQTKVIPQDALSRRALLARMMAAGLGAAVLGLGPAAQASGRRILNIVNVPDDGRFPGIPGKNETQRALNYALTLETLEADIYRQALNQASGKPLSTPLPADASSYALTIPTGGLSDLNAQLGFTYIQQFAAVEAAHRDFLRTAISSMNFEPVGANPGGYTVDFGAGDLLSVLYVLRNVEETGVRAYLGAAQFISSTEVIQVAASIYSTEARHSAALNLIVGLPVGPSRRSHDSQAVFDEHGDNNFEHWQTPTQVLTSVQPFLA